METMLTRKTEVREVEDYSGWSLRDRLELPLFVPEWGCGLGRILASLRACETVVLLPARTDTRWCWAFVPGRPYCYLRSRIRFPGHRSGAPFPSMVVYLGARESDFLEEFADIAWGVARSGATYFSDRNKKRNNSHQHQRTRVGIEGA
jgi:hypothetical protein